ncbi:hypothetical protein CR492_03430 [Methylocella silvestris]|uniref:Uncharacterized protein n=1 Tax=Methylocella silvestris TaxID=199596 RepID=A0A2J7TMF9_METSI|nr:hypothetical protein CR492_03430 [Methylocella silvestris]
MHDIASRPILTHHPLEASFGDNSELQQRAAREASLSRVASDRGGRNPITDDEALRYLPDVRFLLRCALTLTRRG